MVTKRVQRGRQEKEVKCQRISNWSELHTDLLQGIFERLSFVSLNRAKLVCSSWYYASKGCVPNQNQIPWLISFPPGSNSCELLVPEDNETVYRSRDFGLDFAKSYCLTTCGSWLLLINNVHDLYILNFLTGERIDLPVAWGFRGDNLKFGKACFWIDNKTKDYLVVTALCRKFIKKGYSNWENLPIQKYCLNVFYNDKNQELYVQGMDQNFNIWDFSGDKPGKYRTLSLPLFTHEIDDEFKSRIVVTVSGEVLKVTYRIDQRKTWLFRIFKINRVDNKWVQIDSLGDEALIYDMGITVVANDSIPGIKRNSIYFSNKHVHYINGANIFVYDLTTQQKELLPQQCVKAIVLFSGARWFFPC